MTWLLGFLLMLGAKISETPGLCWGLSDLLGMWRSITVVGSPKGSGCGTLSAFAWQIVSFKKKAGKMDS
jgi:hypothetical protein